jgi:hypothetical protein
MLVVASNTPAPTMLPPLTVCVDGVGSRCLHVQDSDGRR